MEAEAAQHALEALPTNIRHVRLYVDNTVFAFALKHRMSLSYHMNEVVARIDEWRRRNGVLLDVFYVPTKMNPADPLSRNDGPAFTPTHFPVLAQLCCDGGGGGVMAGPSGVMCERWRCPEAWEIWPLSLS